MIKNDVSQRKILWNLPFPLQNPPGVVYDESIFELLAFDQISRGIFAMSHSIHEGLILSIVERKKRIEEIDGIGCDPVLISVNTEEMLEWIGAGLRSQALAFPNGNNPAPWTRRLAAELLKSFASI